MYSLVTLAEVADLHRVSVDTARRWMREGKIRPVSGTIGKKHLFKREDVLPQGLRESQQPVTA